MEILAGRVCPQFIDGVEALGLEAATIPEFEAFSDRLEAVSGWRVEAVEGQLSGRDYWEMIIKKRFPAATRLRGMQDLSHAMDPDMFHDVFGHLPLLADSAYSDFLRGMSRIALEHLDEPGSMRSLGRAYKWTIEYGLMRSESGLSVYGAGLISSSKEIDHVFSDKAQKLPFSVGGALATKHVPSSLQSSYFMIESFEQLLESFPEMSLMLRRERDAAPSA